MFGTLRSRFIPTFALTLCLTLGFTSAEDSKQRFTPGYVPGWKAVTNATIVLSDSETLEQSTNLLS